MSVSLAPEDTAAATPPVSAVIEKRPLERYVAPAKPSLVGLSRHAATTKAQHLGLDPVFARVHSEQTAGTVIAQRPYQGRRVPKGIPVYLTLSSGPAAPPYTPPTPSPKPGPGKGHEHHHHGHGNKEKD